MNQPQTILKNTVVLGLSEIIERLTTVYLSICVARQLGANAFGAYSVAMVYYNLLFLAAELGFTTYLVREVSRDRNRTSQLVVHTAIMAGISGLLISGGARLLLPFVGFSPATKHALYITVWAVVPATMKAIQEAIFIAHQKAEFITYSALVASAVNLAATLYLLSIGYGVTGLLTVFTIVQFLLAAFYLVCINRYIVRLGWTFNFATVFSIVRDLGPFAGTSFIQGFLSRPEVILLSFTRSDAQIGFYSAALKIVDLWQLVPKSFMTSVFPVLSSYYRASNQQLHKLRDHSIRYLLALCLPVAVGLYVSARPLVHWVYGSNFDSSVLMLQILAWTIPLGTLWAVLWRVLSARGEHGAALQGQVVTLLFRLTAGFLAIRFFGITGAAVSTTISMLLLDLLLAYKVTRDGTRLSLIQLSGRSALAAIAMGFVAWALRDYLELWTLTIVSVLVYSSMMALFRAFSMEDFNLLRTLRQTGNS